MFTIKMADICIGIDNKYDYIEKMCRDYMTTCDEKHVDICVSASEEAVKKEQDTAYESQGIMYPPEYCEAICIYREINERLIDYNAFLMHGACIEMDGVTYAFCAKSGTGKSTHLTYWKKVYGDNAHIINGDKPIIRLTDGTFFVYGTPWCGKEGWNINTKAPLKALCFLKRGEANKIERITSSAAVKLLAHQIIMPKKADELIKYLNLMDTLLLNIPAYELYCNMSVEAAKVAYEGMK